MDLNLFTEREHKNDFTNNFIKELREFLGKHQNKRLPINLDELTSEELSKYNRQRDNLLKQYRLDTMEKGDMFVVKTEPPHLYHDRYKIEQIVDNMLNVKTLYYYQLPKGIHEGDVLRKVGDKYIFDKGSTMYINEQLEKIKKDIISERKQN